MSDRRPESYGKSADVNHFGSVAPR